MRAFAITFLFLTSCLAQSDQSRVEAVLKQMERAEQTGDFNTYLGLWSREKAADLEKMRPYAKAQPDRRYRLIRAFVHGSQAVILAQIASDSFVTLMLRKEGDQWKIQDQPYRDTAPDPNSVYALVPPDPGAFARAGSPWDRMPPAIQMIHQDWKLRAVFDETYLYIRIESNADLPAPGSTVQTPPGGWPVLKIVIPAGPEFVLYDAVNVGDQATFDEHGKANSHRAYAAYMIRLERNNKEIFSASADLRPSPLLSVAGRNYEIRLPLAAMGVVDSSATKMTIGDAQWPKSAVVSLDVPRYPR